MTIKKLCRILFRLYAYIFVSLNGTALADTFSGNVNVHIVETISIVEDQQINFGTLLNESGTCTMTVTGFTFGDIFSCAGTEDVGIFTVSGSSGTTINVSASSGTANDITFNPTLPNGNTLSLTGAGPGSSGQVIVAGSIIVGTGASNGVTQIPYTLTADYN